MTWVGSVLKIFHFDLRSIIRPWSLQLYIFSYLLLSWKVGNNDVTEQEIGPTNRLFDFCHVIHSGIQQIHNSGYFYWTSNTQQIFCCHKTLKEKICFLWFLMKDFILLHISIYFDFHNPNNTLETSVMQSLSSSKNGRSKQSLNSE